MATIFCSTKLSTLIGNSLQAASAAAQPIDKMDSWNGHLFLLGGKKCIVFVNKATLFTMFKLGVVKRDLADLNKFFQSCLTQQLKASGLTELPLLATWVTPASEHQFFRTDNDKVMVGTINHLVENFRYLYKGEALGPDLEARYGSFANDYMQGALKNKTPLDEIARLANGGVPVPPKPPKSPLVRDEAEGHPNPEFLISEPLSEIVRFGADRILKEFCEDRVPYEYRDQIRLECKFDGDSAIISERRPDWEGGPNWSDMAIIRFRYNNRTARWTVYWCDSKDKWHLCDDFEPTESLADLVIEVDEDESGRFWG